MDRGRGWKFKLEQPLLKPEADCVIFSSGIMRAWNKVRLVKNDI